MAPQETIVLPAESDSIQQYTTQNTAICPEHSSNTMQLVDDSLEQTVAQPQTTSSDNQQNSNQPESSGLTTQQPTAVSHTVGATYRDNSQPQATDLTPHQQTVQLKASDSSKQDKSNSPVSSPENTSSKQEPQQESRCSKHFVPQILNVSTTMSVIIQLIRHCLFCFRGELSESFMTSLHTLQKALGEPNAFSQQGAVCISVELCR